LTFIYQGAIGLLNDHAAKLLGDSIKTVLHNSCADVIVFHLLPESSPLLKRLKAERLHALGLRNSRWAHHWELTLGSAPGFLVNAMKSKHRSWIRRKQRELESAFPRRITWTWHTGTNDVRPLCEKLERVALQTYQRGLGVGFMNDQQHQERFGLFARQGKLRVLMLKTDAQPKAFWAGTVYRGTFYSSVTGFVPELAEYEVGTQMFLRLADELVKEGIGRFDFGLGDADYKRRFGDRSWRETTVRLFGATLRGKLLHLYVPRIDDLDQFLRTRMQAFGLFDKLKQAWRRRLSYLSGKNPK
jgi:hypothetical protein